LGSSIVIDHPVAGSKIFHFMQPTRSILTNNFVVRAAVAIFRHFDTVPACIVREQYRFYVISNIGFTMAWMIHLVWLVAFAGLGQYTMMQYQVVSIACHVVAIILNRRGFHLSAMAIGVLEVVGHQFIAVRLLGWGAGFQYLVIAITVFPFLMTGGGMLVRTLLVVCSLCSFLYLDTFVKGHPPVFYLGEQVTSVFNYFNIILSFATLATWGIFLNIGIRRAEEKLLREKQALYEAEKAAEQAEIERQLQLSERDNEIYKLRNVELKASHDEIVLRNRQIEEEKRRSETLLLNILPEQTARELLQEGKARTRKYELATVLFADFAGFTTIAEQLTPEDLVKQIDNYFHAFDEITLRYGLEKIKTIGDAYMCAGGIPIPNTTNPIDAVCAAVDMMHYIQSVSNDLFTARIGVHTGPLVAGVVGKHKFQYDIWGDTVNIAARMEQHSIPGKINISGDTYELVKDRFACEYRGKIPAKNKGDLDMYFVTGRL